MGCFHEFLFAFDQTPLCLNMEYQFSILSTIAVFNGNSSRSGFGRQTPFSEKNQGTKSNRGLWIAPAHSFEAVLAPALATQMLAPSNALPVGVEFWLRD